MIEVEEQNADKRQQQIVLTGEKTDAGASVVACSPGHVLELTTSAGTIESPGYALNQYPNDAFCQWRIQAPTGATVTMTFDELYIESSMQCDYDSVTLYDGPDASTPLIGKYCGGRLPQPVTSSSSAVSVVFVSDMAINAGRFALSWKFNEAANDDPCVPDYLVQKRDRNGTVRFPLSGTNYPSNAICRWQIIAPAGKLIRLTFTKLDVELSDGCVYDHLTVFDGNDERSPTIGVYCGTATPQELIQSSNTTLLIAFVSDEAATGRGFVVDWLAVDNTGPVPDNPSCGQPAITPSVTLTDRIIGGVEARPHSFPWQCSIRYKYRSPAWGQFCGASVLTNDRVVTAAHCIFDEYDAQIPKEHFKVICGEHDQKVKIDEARQSSYVAAIVIHESFALPSNDFDIAIFQLATNLTFNDFVRPICLPTVSVAAGTNCVVTGWGYTKATGDWSSVLRQVVVPVVAQTQCDQPAFYGRLHHITENMLCAGYTAGGKDACQGDSGGPLVCRVNDRWWLHGVVSFGSGCAEPRKPGVYARVTKFVDWIHQHT